VELAEPKVYFPFIRLALARFQPTSEKGAHISAVVRAEYAQLLPSRKAVYRFTHDGAGGVHIEAEVSGVGFLPSASRSRTAWTGVVERRAGPASTELEWEAIGTLLPGPAGGDVRFQGSFDLTGFQADQFRVVVRELELFPAAEPDPAPSDAGRDREAHGHRVVYADARVVV